MVNCPHEGHRTALPCGRLWRRRNGQAYSLAICCDEQVTVSDGPGAAGLQAASPPPCVSPASLTAPGTGTTPAVARIGRIGRCTHLRHRECLAPAGRCPWAGGASACRNCRASTCAPVHTEPAPLHGGYRTCPATRSIAARLRSTSASVVAHDDTLIRMAARPCQRVPPHQQVPSS